MSDGVGRTLLSDAFAFDFKKCKNKVKDVGHSLP